MVAVPIAHPAQASRQPALPGQAASGSDDWTKYVAAGALIAGGALMVAGNKRAGLVVAAAGTALAMLDQQETVSRWWHDLPGYLREAEVLLTKVEGYIDDASAQGRKLQSMLRR